MANQKDTKTYIYLSVLLLIGGIFSCAKNDEEHPIPDRYEEIEVNLHLTIPAARQITYSETKAEQENISFSLGRESTRSGDIEEIEKPTIDNLWVLQFDDNQTLISKTFQSNESGETSFTFSLYDSDNTTLFFIANLSDETDIDLELYSSTIKDLQKLYFQFTDEAPQNRVLLTGEYKGKIKEYTSIEIELERMIAKLSLELIYKETLNNGDKLTITNISLKSIPTFCFYYNSGETSQTPAENFNWFTDYTSQDVLSSGETFVWYIPENLQGTNLTISNQQMKYRDHAPYYSTYIEITGEYTESGQSVKPVIISLYPGENITTDFNIQRNAHYPMTVTINNLDPDNDKRVEVVQ